MRKSPTVSKSIQLQKGANDSFNAAAGYASSAIHGAQRYGGEVVKKVVGVASDVMSAPSRAVSTVKQIKSEGAAKALKRASSWDNAPGLNSDGSVTQAFKDRSVAGGIKMKMKRK